VVIQSVALSGKALTAFWSCSIFILPVVIHEGQDVGDCEGDNDEVYHFSLFPFLGLLFGFVFLIFFLPGGVLHGRIGVPVKACI